MSRDGVIGRDDAIKMILCWPVRPRTRTEERLGAISRDGAIGRDETIRVIWLYFVLAGAGRMVR